MADATLSDAEIVRRGRAIYDSRIRSLVEPAHNGRFVAIDIDSGDYEIADAAIDAMDRLDQRHADALYYVHRIGFASAYKFGKR